MLVLQFDRKMIHTESTTDYRAIGDLDAVKSNQPVLKAKWIQRYSSNACNMYRLTSMVLQAPVQKAKEDAAILLPPVQEAKEDAAILLPPVQEALNGADACAHSRGRLCRCREVGGTYRKRIIFFLV